MRYVRRALRSQGSARHRPLVTRPEPLPVSGAHRLAAPDSAAGTVQGQSARAGPVTGRRVAARDAASVEDTRARIPRRARRGAPARRGPDRTLVLEPVVHAAYGAADRAGRRPPRGAPRAGRPRR